MPHTPKWYKKKKTEKKVGNTLLFITDNFIDLDKRTESPAGTSFSDILHP